MAKTKSVSTKVTAPVGTKTDFVNSMPEDTPAKQVVEKAKENGITITPGVVHAIRSNVRKRAGAAPRRRGRPVGSGKAKKRAGAAEKKQSLREPRGGAQVEDLLRAIAAEMGLGRAIAELQAARSTVQQALRA